MCNCLEGCAIFLKAQPWAIWWLLKIKKLSKGKHLLLVCFQFLWYYQQFFTSKAPFSSNMFIAVPDYSRTKMAGYLEANYFTTCKISCNNKSVHTWAVCSASVDIIISLPLLSDLIRMDEDHQHPYQTNERNQGGRTESSIYVGNEASTNKDKKNIVSTQREMVPRFMVECLCI